MAADPDNPPEPPATESSDEKLPLPRGASGAELDVLRATVRVSGRTAPPPQPPRRAPVPTAPPLPQAANVIHAPELNKLIDQGREVLEQDPAAAHRLFEQAYRRNLNDVRVLSHYGLTLVLVEKNRERGICLCEEAVRRGPVTTELLVNLARALVQTRNKEQAVRALRKAQELAPSDPQVSREFLALGLRRRPPIPFLPRSFFLNRWIGKLTWKYGKRSIHPTLQQP